MKIILASASPRRRELLAGLGLDYTVLASGVEEQITEKEPAKVVEELSAQKAGDVLQRLLAPNFRKGDDEELLVIGADTIVSIEGQILGKPADERDGAEMLKRLSGRQHQVYTGVTLYHWHRGETRKCTFHECTQVWFYPMTQEEISWYISTGEPMDKAGAYGIQGLGPFCESHRGRLQ